jgi:hypothetical protein
MKTITPVSVLWSTVVAITLSAGLLPSFADDWQPPVGWSEDIKITTDSFFQSERQYAFDFDPQGNIHIAIDEFSPSSFPLTITYMKYEEDWNLLVDRLPLTPAFTAAWWPSIGADHLGNAHVVYVAYAADPRYHTIHYSKIDAGGNIVVNAMRLSIGVNRENHPRIEVDLLGQVHVTYTSFQIRPGVHYVKLDNDGNKLVSPRLVSPRGAWEFSKPLVDASGDVYVIASPGGFATVSSGAWITKLDALGFILVGPVRIDDDIGIISWMTGAIDGNGDIHVVYRMSYPPPEPPCLQPSCLQSDLPPPGYFYSKLDANCSEIIADKPMSHWALYYRYLEMVCDRTGNVHVMSQGSFPSGPSKPSRTVSYCKLDNDGNELETNVALVEPGEVDTKPSMNIREADDTLFVGWCDGRSGTLEHYIKHTVPICNPDPASQGYWHRQCLGVPESEGGIDPGWHGRGPQSPTEPDFAEELMPCADNRLDDLDFSAVSTCGGMETDPPNDQCEKALTQLTALVLNVCSQRLADSCDIDLGRLGCSSTTVGELFDEAASLIQTGECKQAKKCVAAVNEGHALVINTNAELW